MDVSGVQRGPRTGLVSLHLVSGFRVLECPAYKVDRVLGAFCFLDKGSTDGVIGGRDVYQQGLGGVRFAKDGG